MNHDYMNRMFAEAKHNLAIRNVKTDDFHFAIAGLETGHINLMCDGLVSAGARLKWIYDTDESKYRQLAAKHPGAAISSSVEEILSDSQVSLVIAAGIPSERAELSMRVMAAGKNCLCDKAPFTTLEQLEQIKKVIAETGRKYFVFYSERLNNEGALAAGELIRMGAVGRVFQVTGLGPHKLNPQIRSNWFFRKETNGGIICDLGSHLAEQFLFYTGERDGTVAYANVKNFGHPQYPDFEDFGEAVITGKNGSSGYFRVDWFTPDSLPAWGDSRVIVCGTEGTIEVRKNMDVARYRTGGHIYLANQKGQFHFSMEGETGYPFFSELIQDCRYDTDTAMPLDHTLKAAQLSLTAQMMADGRMV